MSDRIKTIATEKMRSRITRVVRQGIRERRALG